MIGPLFSDKGRFGLFPKRSSTAKTAVLSTKAFYFVLETYSCSESFLVDPLNLIKFQLQVFLLFSSPTERVNEVLNDFCAAITNEEEKKSNSVKDELKTNTTELMEKPETIKRG